MLQDLIVALLVLGCASYAAWTLMPAAARRTLAGALLKLPLPAGFERKMRLATVATSGCGCDSCDHAPAAVAAKAAAQQPQVINFHPRPRR